MIRYIIYRLTLGMAVLFGLLAPAPAFAGVNDILVGGKVWDASAGRWAQSIMVRPGDTIKLTLFATNFSATETISSVKMSDSVPAHTSYSPGSSFRLDAAGSWQIMTDGAAMPFLSPGLTVGTGSLGPLQSAQYRYSVTVPSNLPTNITTLLWAGPALAFTDQAGISQTVRQLHPISIAVSHTGGGIQPPPAGQGKLLLSHETLSFGDVALGQTSTKSFTISNSSTAGGNLTVSNISLDGGAGQFQVTGGSFTLSPGTSRTINVTFAPNTAGSFSRSILINSNDPSRPNASISVTGRGTTTAPPPTDGQGRLLLSHETLAFGDVPAGQMSTKTFTVSNSSTATGSLTISSINLSQGGAGYLVSPSSVTLAPGTSREISVTFTPSTVGSFANTVILASNDPSRPTASISLTGRGTGTVVTVENPRILISHETLAFGPVPSRTSVSKTFTVSNSSTAGSSLNITDVRVSVDAGAFRVTPRSVTIAPGASQTFTVTFEPADVRSYQATISIDSNDPSRPAATLNVTGAGTGVTTLDPDIVVSVTRIDFGAAVPNETIVKSVTIASSQLSTQTLTITRIRVDGTSAPFTIVDQGPFSLSPGQSRTIDIRFTPTERIAYTRALIIESNDPDEATVTVQLVGTGEAQVTPPTGGPSATIGLHPNGTLLRAHDMQEVWYIEGGKKKHVPSPTVFRTRFRWEDVVVLPDSSEILRYERGPNVRFAPGTLVRESGRPEVWRVSFDGGRAHITSPSVLRGRGGNFRDVIPVGAGDLDEYPIENPINDPNVILPGDLIKLANDPRVWYVMAGNSARYVRRAVFEQWAFRWASVRVVSQAQMNQVFLEQGELFFPNGTLIKGSGSSVYAISDFTKRPILSGADFEGLLYEWRDIVGVSDEELNRMPTGEVVRALRKIGG